jgi:hypothetical protein
MGFWRVAALGGAAAVCGARGAAAAVATQRSGGSCVPYDGPAQGGCGFLAGKTVFKFDGTDSMSAMQVAFDAHVAFMLNAAGSVASTACINDFLPLVCSTWFPECDGNGKPRHSCLTGCQKVHSADWCASAFQVAAAAGLDNIIVKCDRKIGQGAGEDGFEDHVYPNYLAEWVGEPAFQAPTYTDGDNSMQCLPLKSEGGSGSGSGSGSGGGAETCMQKKCAEPLKLRFFPKMGALRVCACRGQGGQLTPRCVFSACLPVPACVRAFVSLPALATHRRRGLVDAEAGERGLVQQQRHDGLRQLHAGLQPRLPCKWLPHTFSSRDGDGRRVLLAQAASSCVICFVSAADMPTDKATPELTRARSPALTVPGALRGR